VAIACTLKGTKFFAFVFFFFLKKKNLVLKIIYIQLIKLICVLRACENHTFKTHVN